VKPAETDVSILPVNHSSGICNVVTGTDIFHHIPRLLSENNLEGSACIVSDHTVAQLYEPAIQTCLANANIVTLPSFVFRPGEKSKSFSTLKRLLSHMIKTGMSRNDFVVALGGGVTGDLAGFAASIYMRGISYIQVPTTLLAQADSSIGGKTGINCPQGKNLIGAFHAPRLAICDLKTLDTLPLNHIKNGLAEIIKMAVIGDPECFIFLEKYAGLITHPEHRDKLEYALKASCQLKCQIVQKDEKETGIRTWLNLGHSFAHAIECSVGYGKLLHGEAVALGMLAAGQLAVKLSICNPIDVERIRSLLILVGLPVRLPKMDIQTVSKCMMLDKKNRFGKLRLVLPEQIGTVTIIDNVSVNLIETSLHKLI
jgi:3-dehydroquinate synthase